MKRNRAISVLYTTILTGLIITCGLSVKGQVRPCAAMLKKADSLSLSRSFKAAALLYFDSFAKAEDCRTNANLIKAAKVCVQAKITDSAIKYISIVVQRGAQPLFSAILNDGDFFKLRHNQRWIQLKAQLERYLSPVALELNSLFDERLGMAAKLQAIRINRGINSGAFRLFTDSISQKDLVNEFKIESIIRTYGWLGKEQIGESGVRSLMFLYEKLSFKEQKKYYPLIATGFKTGTITAEHFANMTDKIALQDKGRQIYGTQFEKNNQLYPVQNPDSLQFRRAAIGLPPG